MSIFDYIFLALLIFFVLPVIWFGCAVLLTALYDAPFVPLKKHNMQRMFQIVNFSGKHTVYDLGSGDGRVVTAVAKNTHAQCVGVERSFILRLFARLRIVILGYGQRIVIRSGDFFDCDLSNADVVICYLFPKVMQKLGEKFRRELAPGSLVVSFSFEIPGITPVTKDKPHKRSQTIFVYRY